MQGNDDSVDKLIKPDIILANAEIHTIVGQPKSSNEESEDCRDQKIVSDSMIFTKRNLYRIKLD